MKTFRIVQDETRTTDLSDTCAFKLGGRWNSKGTYMLYTSENSSLALLEISMHFDNGDMPPDLFVMEIEIADESLIYKLPEDQYNKNWLKLLLLENQTQGDGWMKEKKWLGVRVKSAINSREYNVLLNPQYPGYHDLVKVISVTRMAVDEPDMLP
ncbi:MAG TPA: RES family NAD+ phosphorylase [Chitinophagaceae bacterium]|jgi:RES domain-containing protein